MARKGATLSTAAKLASAQGRAVGAIKEIQADAQRAGEGRVIARLESAVYAGTDPIVALAAVANGFDKGDPDA